MNVGKTMGDQYREARLRATDSNAKLATHAGAAEVLEVSAAETIGRWERDEVTPSNINVRKMAIVYRAPELMANYCANDCPIGKGRVRAVRMRPVEQLAIRLQNISKVLADDVGQLMEIAEDGVIDDNERGQFNEITTELGEIAHTISMLQLIAERINI